MSQAPIKCEECESSNRRKRAVLAPQKSEKAPQIVIKEEDQVESGVDASHDPSPSVVQDSSISASADSINSRFAEYWVPVELTDIQLEQSGSTLIKETELLCSSKKPNLDLLQGVLGDLRKCCDHPYVLDPSLQIFRKECCPLVDYLSIGIQASGKLQLLSKLLPTLRDLGSKVLIAYKTASGFGKIGQGIGNILDDFICRSFGQESYVHIYAQKYANPKKKQAAVDLFNDRTSRTFVVLTAYSSYPTSIRLTSSDVVILFNSDWNPTTDIRSLQKMSLHADDNGQLRVLRLYSLYTAEEKALRMAQESSAVNRNRDISKSTCEKLVSWGATHLFKKLDAIYTSSTSESNKSSEDGCLYSVLKELSTIFSSNLEYSRISCSVISKAYKIGEGCYGNIKMHGKQHLQSPDDVPSHIIWSSLLQGRIPCWRFLPKEPGYSKKRERAPEISEGLLHEEIPSCHRDANHNGKRSKRVRRCVSGVQQMMKKFWYMKADELCKKRKLKKKNIRHLQAIYDSQKSLNNLDSEKELLISEISGASYRKLGRFNLDNGIQHEGVCNDMGNWMEDHYPAHLTPRNNECLDTFYECLPTEEMVDAIGSDSDYIYVGPVTDPVAEPELSDPIHLEDLIASECILNAVSGSLPVAENQGPLTGMQSSEELAMQHDTVKEQIELQQSIDHIHQLPSEQLPQLASLDPLQSELTRIQNALCVETKNHEETLLQLRAARVKEEEQIRQKYDLLHQNEHKNFIQNTDKLMTQYEKIEAHKALAEAWKLSIDDNSIFLT